MTVSIATRVLRLTAGKGVDCIVEAGGAGTLALSLNALALDARRYHQSSAHFGKVVISI